MSFIVFTEIAADGRLVAHLSDERLVEPLGRVDTAPLQQMMHRDDFGDHGDVLAGIEMNGNARNGDTENVRVLVVQSGTVHVGALTPLLELNDDLDALLLAHRADAEDGRNVHEPDAANLHVMALELVAASNEDVVAAATREHEIVGNDPVSTLDEIEHALGFADPALPDEQKPDTVDIGQRAV